VADQAGIEHRVEVVAVGPGALMVPSQRGARRAGEGCAFPLASGPPF